MNTCVDILIFKETDIGVESEIIELYSDFYHLRLLHIFVLMDNERFDKAKLINYWIDGSNDDFETMVAMFDSKRYSWSLFIGHLMIEKLLKAYFVKVKSDYPPYIHNLLRLAEKSDLKLTDDVKEILITITAFNINARYDDYKLSFKQRCTPQYTEKWIEKIKKVRLWINQLI